MVDDYSVSELAECVASAASPRPAEAYVDLVIRRLRSWTVAGALLPIDDPYSGTGKHRHYDRAALYCAAVLNVLAENDQSIGTLVAFGRLIRGFSGSVPLHAGVFLERWEQAIAQKAVVYLITTRGRMRGGSDSGVTEVTVDSLFLEEELPLALKRYAGGVFVNLTAVFAGLLR
jgi:hypothetical protein